MNEYIENATTFDAHYIKTKNKEIAEILQKVHGSSKELEGEFKIFDEIKKYENLIQGEIKYAYYDKIRDKVFGLQSHLEEIGIDRKSCHIDLVPENFIEDETGRVYLIEEGDFFKYYYSEKTPVSIAKIMIYKILQDFLWSLWTIYKEEQGADFGSYGQDRYNRCLKNLKEYLESYEK